jgi:hypothetical protein
VGRRVRGDTRGENENNVQYKSDWIYHFESPPLYNEYILIKNKMYNKISYI